MEGLNFDTVLEAIDRFIITPKERMEYEATLARAQADQSLASAQIASAQQQNQTLTYGFILLAAGGIGFLLWNSMK